VVDMGPEGGNGGGLVVAEGTPEQVAGVPASHTGKFLRDVLGADRISDAASVPAPRKAAAKKAVAAKSTARKTTTKVVNNTATKKAAAATSTTATKKAIPAKKTTRARKA
ncbi:excinuclease ABC subunit A, partial [Streptomyces mirabilis]